MSPTNKLEKLPKHIAIIMDGNGRWAKQKGNSRIFGHHKGIKAIRETLEYCVEKKIQYLTLFTFSTENWNRPKFEVKSLMSLIVKSIKNELNNFLKNNVKLSAIGDLEQIPKYLRKTLLDAINRTKDNTGVNFILALNYSGKWDLLNAIKNITADLIEKKINAESINSSLIYNYLSTKNIPDPELLIRTSGEYRISNFFLWQLAYTELYFTDVLWPDFRKKDLELAIAKYLQRERRFGKISE